MQLSTESVWRLDELVERSQRVLALVPASSGESRRVRWQPDARLVRYYTTLGLLDRPAEMRGRTAYYRDRHLLQLLAIKTLQARGLSLQTVQIQLMELAMQPDAALARLIGLPMDWATRLTAANNSDQATLALTENARIPTLEDSSRFWERPPAPAMTVSTAISSRSPPVPTDRLTAHVTASHVITIAPGAHLLLDSHRYPTLDERLEAALQHLRTVLATVASSPHNHADGGEEQ